MTLSEFSLQARVIVKLGGVFFVAIMIVYLGIMGLLALRPERTQTSRPTPLAPDQLTFGKIPLLEIPSLTDKKPNSYVLDTLDGGYPVATTEAKIYFIPDGSVTLSSAKEADNMAKTFAFSESVIPIRVDDAVVEYSDSDKTLAYNKKSKTFRFFYNPGTALQNLIEATPSGVLSTIEEQAENSAISLMRERGDSRDIVYKTNITYVIYDLQEKFFKIVQGDLQPQGIRIDFFKQNQDGLPVVSPSYFTSQDYIIMAPLNPELSLVEMQYMSHKHLNTTDQFGATYPGVYPLISSESAWKALNEGKASIISYNPTSEPVKIKDIFLAYYDSSIYQQYLQPIYVFLGSDNFVGYLPAVDPSYTGNGT